jgi:hypothetical protein
MTQGLQDTEEDVHKIVCNILCDFSTSCFTGPLANAVQGINIDPIVSSSSSDDSETEKTGNKSSSSRKSQAESLQAHLFYLQSQLGRLVEPLDRIISKHLAQCRT